jgi:hypothetical protein
MGAGFNTNLHLFMFSKFVHVTYEKNSNIYTVLKAVSQIITFIQDEKLLKAEIGKAYRR